MTTITFEALASGLYQSKSNLAGQVALHYLLVDGAPPAGPLDLVDAWDKYSGCFFYLQRGVTIADAATFAAALKSKLGSGDANARWLAWVTDANAAQVSTVPFEIQPSNQSPQQATTSANAQIPIGNVHMAVAANSSIVLQTSASPSGGGTGGGGPSGPSSGVAGRVESPSILIEPASYAGLSLQRTNDNLYLGARGRVMAIPTVGPQLGALVLDTIWYRSSLYKCFRDDYANADPASGPEVRFSYGPDNTVLRYPVYPPGPAGGPTSQPDTSLLLMQAQIDPLNPADTKRTSFALDRSAFDWYKTQPEKNQPQWPTAPFFRSTHGTAVELVPNDGAGFGLATRPALKGETGEGPFLYLTPIGESTVSGKPDSTINLMCGLAGTEFLLVRNGDTIEFEPGHPAHAAVFTPPSSASESAPTPDLSATLDDKLQTPWVRVTQAAGNVAPPSENGQVPIRFGYCVQPGSSVYYGGSVDKDHPYPVAVGCLVSTLHSKPAFPMVPYANAYGATPDQDTSVNAGVDPDVIGTFEAGILSVNRRSIVPLDEQFGPRFFDSNTDNAFQGGYATTPEGLLLSLNDGDNTSQNPAGSWNELVLAKSPVTGKRLEMTTGKNPKAPSYAPSYDPSQGVVNPHLANALMNDNLFMVVTNAAELGTFESTPLAAKEEPVPDIQVDEWTFKLQAGLQAGVAPKVGQPAPAQKNASAVLLFKFSTTYTVAEYVQNTSNWHDTDVFVGKPDDVDHTRDWLNYWIESAQSSGNALFDDFNKKVHDKSWTGVLAVNCPLDYEALPADLQMLLGGIDGELVAFHFGVTANRVQTSETDPWDIERSSLFALVHYNRALAAPQSDFQFQVLRLNALFVNTALAHFDARVAMSIQKLFGDGTKLTTEVGNDHPETNTIEINGVYQKEPGQKMGHVVFDSGATARAFSFGLDGAGRRVIEKMYVTDAALVPVSSTPQAHKSVIVDSAFKMSGRLAFGANLGSADKVLDLFSYPKKTVAADPVGITYATYDFPMTTTLKGDSAKLADIAGPDLANMQVGEFDTSPRDESLIGTLPARLQAFRFARSGISAASVDGYQVTEDDDPALQSISPGYALEFKLPLGSLGDLVSKSVLEGSLLVGWSAAASASADDEVGLILVLPPEMRPGQFKLQGILPVTFDTLKLTRLSLPAGNVRNELYAFCMEGSNDAQFSIAMFGTQIIGGATASLEMYGDPSAPRTGNLMWFLNEGGDKSDWGSASTALSFTPFIGAGFGLDVNIDPLEPNVVGKALEALTTLPGTTQEAVASWYKPSGGGEGEGGEEAEVTPNPNGGMLFWLDIFLFSSSFQFLLDDPSFYGGKLTIGGAEKPEKGERYKSKAPPPFDKLSGFEIDVIYRRINSHLGVYSFDIVLPDSLRKIGTGEPWRLELPEVGLEIWTNGGFKLSVGWPLSSTTTFLNAEPLKLMIQAGEFPLMFALGFYIARLRKGDAPGALGEFGLVWEFGFALRGGLEVEEEAGPLSFDLGLYATLTAQGVLASDNGELTASGVQYHWYALSIAVTFHASGTIDLKIISASITFEVTLLLAVAWETEHKTEIVCEGQVKIDLSLHILFFTIRFKFTITVKFWEATFGDQSLQVAQLTGPTPPEAESLTAGVAAALPPRSLGAAAAVSPDAVVTKQDIPLHFILQPTAVAEVTSGKTTWTPNVVAGFVLTTADFETLVKGTASWLFAKWGLGNTFADQLASVVARLTDGTFHDSVDDFLEQAFAFDVQSGAAPKTPTESFAFPVFTDAALTYDGAAIPQPGIGLPSDYQEKVQAYFAPTNGAPGATASTDTTSAASVREIVFADYFVMIAKQVFSVLQDQKQATTIDEALSDANAKGDFYENVGGMASRFMLHGLRLPDPKAMSTLVALYRLTGQQTPAAKGGKVGLEITQGPLKTVPVSITEPIDDKLIISESITAAPPWTSAAIPAISAHPEKYPIPSILSVGNHVLRPLPDALLAEIRGNSAALSETALDAFTITQSAAGQTTLAAGTTPLDAAPALYVQLTIRKITSASGDGTLKDVYRLDGASEADRDLLQNLLVASDSGMSALSLLVPTGTQGSYDVVTASPDTVLVKTNLATGAAPGTPSVVSVNTGDCPAVAGLDDVSGFLRLVWECSIVHSDGYNLQITDDKLASAFKGGEAQIGLLVAFGAAAARTPVTTYHNALLTAAAPAKSAVFTDVVVKLASAGAFEPVVRYGPVLPAGSAGFALTWPSAPTDITAGTTSFLDSLYHIVTYRVAAIEGVSSFAGSNWSMPVGAHSQDDAAKGTTSWAYRHSLPIYPFVGAGDNRYDAQGRTVDLSLLVLDIFGNAAPEALAQTVQSTVEYNDPLMPTNAWPAIATSYAFAKVDSSVELDVTFAFDAKSIGDEQSGETAKDRASRLALVLATYQKIRDQLADPNVTLTLETTLADGSIALDTKGNSIQKDLLTFVGSVATYVDGLIKGTAQSTPESQSFSVRLSADYPSSWKDDLVEVVVSVEIDRKNVDKEVAAKIPDAAHVGHALSPVQNPQETTAATALREFAIAFEKAYAGFDGGTGALKLTKSRLAVNGVGKAKGSEPLYAVRWGSSGIDVALTENSPTYLAPTPLSTQLLSGTVAVRKYASPWTGKPSDITNPAFDQTFSHVDLDAWMRSFLTALEGVLTPAMAAGIATLDGDLYEPLIKAKGDFAAKLKTRVENVFQGTVAADALTQAQGVLEQALLHTLADDYSVSTVVQVPANVTVAGQIEQGQDPVYAPAVYGKVSAGGDQSASSPYAIEPTTLPLVNGKEWFSFLVSSKHPEAKPDVDLTLEYDIAFLEHSFEGDAAKCGFVPSSWLSFLVQENPDLPNGGKQLMPSIGEVDIPIPLRSFPPAPALLSQLEKALTADDKDPAQALFWSYGMEVSRPVAAQDDLVVTVSFNEPPPKKASNGKDDTPPSTDLDVDPDRTHDDLFDALARFTAEYPAIEKYLPKAKLDGQDKALGTAAVTRFTELVAGVDSTLDAWKNPALDKSLAAHEAGAGAPAADHWSYRLVFGEELTVTRIARSDGTLPPWPFIAGYARPTSTDAKAAYSGTSSTASIALTWGEIVEGAVVDGLFVLTHQSARGYAYVERNVDIAPKGKETNEAFVYRTATVRFPTPIVPLIERDDPLVLPSQSTIRDVVHELVGDFLQSGSGTVDLLKLNWATSYQFNLVDSAKKLLDARTPIFLTHANVLPNGSAGNGDTPRKTFESTIATELVSWHDDATPTEKNAFVAFDVTLFSTIVDGQVPIVRLRDLQAPVPKDPEPWWSDKETTS